jgi:hypothetical protein
MQFREINLDSSNIPDSSTHGRKSKYSKIPITNIEKDLVSDAPLIYSMKQFNF